MSLFGSILSLQDAINRLPQYEHQINRLERDKQDASSRASLRNNFVRQCQQLHRQLDEHRGRIKKVKNEGAYKKENALGQVDKLKERLSVLCPEKEKNSILSVSVDSEEEKSKEKPKPPKLGSIEQRNSIMYEDDSQDDSDNETEIIETDVQLDSAPGPSTVVQPPQPKPRQPIAITQPSLAPKIAEKARRDDEISRLQNPTRGDSSETMEPVIVQGNVFIAFDNWDPEAEGDLRLVKGGKYRITQTRADGWWTALDENGQRGLVPKTYLQHVKEKPKNVPSKVSSRLGVRDSVIALTTTTTNTAAQKRENRKTSGKLDCLGKSFDDDPHLSLVCHLAPRLSTSNIGFHDLFWSKEKDQVFKRTIHISKIIRLVRFEKMPLLEHKALVRMALVEITNPKCTQVVSNVHTLVPRVKSSTWFFEKKESNTRSCIEFSDFVLRSNYSSPTVVLLIEASHIIKTTTGFEEKSLGHTFLRLIIDDKAVPSRTNVLYLDDEIMSKMKIPEASKKRVLIQVMDVPKDKISYVDSLPDVIVFNALYLPFFHFYRRRAGTILIRDNKNPLSAEYVSDPLLSVFPFICDQHDIMDVMLRLWKAKKKVLSKKTEAEQTAEFFQTFIHTAFFINGIQMISYDIKDDLALSIRHQTIIPIFDSLNKGHFKQFIVNQKFLPVNILDYSLDLLGSHSID